ncbi:hypothetical protein M5X00_14810 [Paenibacillus alvei]|uniref:hypothetical protein n=1 Tax=Paenibacillus alvei TaxID=44250 RepID=UPI00028A1C83|nr:hypothetical protein [Paenibacillus alvei]EJW20043.1 hypothetical protein PAV_1c10390 [Paenibacillus alvei DSM 29]MCY9543368.1 hypothetical protein [Paenibacillus alvei]MCY9704752.1 hypothetical protein [Paenibacillus alvei]MCY9733695.1 hypothetical protein [Paenibacillus alvei]MCY9755514.1 hypothetical protein [Paenibacillus alvei]
MDLNKMVQDALAGIQKEQVVEQLVRQKLEKTLASVVDDVLSSYSDFGKQLKKEVESQLDINLKKLDIPTYNQMVLNVVKEQLDKAVTIQGVEKIKAHMDEILCGAEKEYRLSEIIEAMKNEATEYGDVDDNEVSLHVRKGTVLWFIDFDPEEDKLPYDCKYQISILEPKGGKVGKINTVKIHDKELNNNAIMGGLHGLEATLFKMFTIGADLVVDEDNVDMYYPREDW